jgi:hypothetical protein
MTKFCPSLCHHAATRADDYAALDLLQTLERGFSDAFKLLRSIDWFRGDGAHE